jgi:hypothetical protein
MTANGIRMKFKINNTIILPIIALFVCVSVGIAIIAYRVNVRSLERIQTEKENEKSDSIRFTINAIIENHVKALQALAKTLQENKELSESLAYFSASGYSDPVNDVVTSLFPTLNVDIFIITDLDGNVVKTDIANIEGYYSVPGVQEALNGRISIRVEDGPEGWAIRAIAPIHWQQTFMERLSLALKLVTNLPTGLQNPLVHTCHFLMQMAIFSPVQPQMIIKS